MRRGICFAMVCLLTGMIFSSCRKNTNLPYEPPKPAKPYISAIIDGSHPRLSMVKEKAQYDTNTHVFHALMINDTSETWRFDMKLVADFKKIQTPFTFQTSNSATYGFLEFAKGRPWRRYIGYTNPTKDPRMDFTITYLSETRIVGTFKGIVFLDSRPDQLLTVFYGEFDLNYKM